MASVEVDPRLIVVFSRLHDEMEHVKRINGFTERLEGEVCFKECRFAGPTQPSDIKGICDCDYIRKTEIEIDKIKHRMNRLILQSKIATGRYKSPSTQHDHHQSLM